MSRDVREPEPGLILGRVAWRLLHQAQDLNGGYCGDREHEVAGHLVGAAQADHAAGEIVLEIGVDAFGGGALLVADMLGGAQADGFAGLGLGLPRRLAKGRAGQGKLVHSLGLSWLDRGAAFPRMIGSPVGRFADGGMSGPRWGSGYGLTITCRHIGALRLRSGAGPSAWRFALPVEGGRALRVSGWVVAVYWRSF